MTIINQNATVYRGDTDTISVQLTDVNGDPFVLSPGGTVKWRMARTSHDESPTLIQKELNNGLTMDGDIADITLTETDTDLPPGIYYHEVKVFDLGDVATAMTGVFIVRRSLRMTQAHTVEGETLGNESAVIIDATVV